MSDDRPTSEGRGDDPGDDCLYTLTKIASIETMFSELSNNVQNTIVSLIEPIVNFSPFKDNDLAIKATSFKASQDCIHAISTNWKWISDCASCVEIHLKNASEYHQFFHEVNEFDRFMASRFITINQEFCTSHIQGNADSLKEILNEIKDTQTSYLQWQMQVEMLFERSRHVIPLKQRTGRLKKAQLIISLSNYKTKEINIVNGEEMILIDNSSPTSWKVRNSQGHEAVVPAIICLIPPLDAEAVDASLRLRLQLLTTWTSSSKRIGNQIIEFLMEVFRDWNDDETVLLKKLPTEKKTAINSILDALSRSLDVYWQNHSRYKHLLLKIESLKRILKLEFSGIKDDGKGVMVCQIVFLRNVLQEYENFVSYLEKYKIRLETIRQSKSILICDKRENLRFITTAHYIKFWQTELTLSIAKKEMMAQVDQNLERYEEIIVSEEAVLDSASSFDHAIPSSTAETEELISSVQEEKTTLVIKSIYDPNSGEEMSLQQAISLGIMHPETGTYVNPKTGDTILIPEAISKGLIEVAYSTTKLGEESKTSVGLITITTTTQKQNTMMGAKDTRFGKWLTMTEAVDRGIIDESDGIFTDTYTGKKIPLSVAIEQKLVKLKSQTDCLEDGQITRAYAVHAVVDQQQQKRLTFAEAVQIGILDKNTGNYINNSTGETLNVADAINKGFIKGHVVEDPNAIENIDAENRMYVEKIEGLRKKMMKPLKVLHAFRHSSNHTA